MKEIEDDLIKYTRDCVEHSVNERIRAANMTASIQESEWRKRGGVLCVVCCVLCVACCVCVCVCACVCVCVCVCMFAVCCVLCVVCCVLCVCVLCVVCGTLHCAPST